MTLVGIPATHVTVEGRQLLDIKGHGPCLALQSLVQMSKISSGGAYHRIQPVSHLLPSGIMGQNPHAKYISWEAVKEYLRAEQKGWEKSKDDFYEMVKMCHAPAPVAAVPVTPLPQAEPPSLKPNEEIAKAMAKRAAILMSKGLDVDAAFDVLGQLEAVQ